MSLFVVDQEKCNRDGICVESCPVGIIELKDRSSVPTPVEYAEKLCINCGHCVALCPEGALSLKTMATEQCPPVKNEWRLGPEKVEHFLRSRRSIRTYKEKSVEPDILKKLIDIAAFAPSAKNFQPVRWLVVKERDQVRRLAGMVVDWMRYMKKEHPVTAREMHLKSVIASWDAGMDAVCRNAPHIIIAHASKKSHAAMVDCSIALTYLELAAPSFELGTCWGGYFTAAAMNWPPLQKALGLPEGHATFGAMMVGYPKYKYYRLPLRNKAHITWM